MKRKITQHSAEVLNRQYEVDTFEEGNEVHIDTLLTAYQLECRDLVYENERLKDQLNGRGLTTFVD